MAIFVGSRVCLDFRLALAITGADKYAFGCKMDGIG